MHTTNRSAPTIFRLLARGKLAVAVGAATLSLAAAATSASAETNNSNPYPGGCELTGVDGEGHQWKVFYQNGAEIKGATFKMVCENGTWKYVKTILVHPTGVSLPGASTTINISYP